MTETTQTGDSAGDAGPAIGPYHLLHKIGEGGMGEVWLAEQSEPVRRRVALKIIKVGMDTKQVVARFEAERQALALMDHPSIAKVLDGGETPQGRPYFVMEHVQGVPITEHCDRHRLTNRERLDLFVQVCEGVQHAHQKAIIHRDLKPSNVLVTMQDGLAVPKIIDFGVAKATSQRLTEKTLFTELGVLIGTPEYMSPEQAEMTGQGVDTRTDVYALGVMLYELLVGALPFDPKELRSAGFEGIVRKIREDEPPRPSTRLATIGDRSTESAVRRRVDVRTLRNQLRGDLDRITMKALEKDRARRYGSPADLAADVVRHLHDEPVLAGSPGAFYRAMKFVRRHRTGVGVAALGVVGLGIFAASMAWQAGRVAKERDRAVREAKTAERVADVLVGSLAIFDPRWKDESPVTAEALFDRTAAHLEGALEEEPEVRARILRLLGVVYRVRGRFDDARRVMEASIEISRKLGGDDDLRVLRTQEMLAWLELDFGRRDRAEELFRRIAAGRSRVLGPTHPDTLEAIRGLELARQAQQSR